MKLSELKPGDKLTGFTFWECVPENATRIVYQDELGLFVRCKEGNHYLNGQEDEPNGELHNMERKL